MQLCDMERWGGVGQHVSPFVQSQDLGNLLNRCGFTMLTVDNDELKASYTHLLRLMDDLKGMGEGNAAWTRKGPLYRDS